MNRPPLVAGGQGRTSHSLRRDAGHLGWLLLLALALIALAFLRRAVG